MLSTVKTFLYLVFCLFFLAFSAQAQTIEVEFEPYFASLRSSEVNLRTGPGYRYPIEWVYNRRHLPVKVINKFEHWRELEDHEGGTGWVHKNLLSDQLAVWVTQDKAKITRDPTNDSLPVARLEKGVIGLVKECRYEWCLIKIEPFEGWIHKSKVWGID